MVRDLAETITLGFLLAYMALLIGLGWWAWGSRGRSGRRSSSFLGALRESGPPLAEPGTEEHHGAADRELADEK